MIFDVITFTEHENFFMDTVDDLNNDIAIIELAKEVDLATYTPACLAQTSDLMHAQGSRNGLMRFSRGCTPSSSGSRNTES